jgi:hypothetical protein
VWPWLFLACGPAGLPVEDPPADTGAPDGPDTPIGPPGTTGTPRPLELCVNELVPGNVASATDETGAHPDWIELHNPSDHDLPLDGWTLTDDPQDPDKHRLARGLVLEAGGFLLLWADGQPDLGPTHLDFSLSEDGEAVGVFAPDGTGTIVRYGPVAEDLAIARITDCCAEDGCFEHVLGGSPGASNAP